MDADPELAGDLDLSQRPGPEGPQRTEGDRLPQAAGPDGREGKAVLDVRRIDADPPDVPGVAQGCAIDDQGRPERGEDRRRHAEEPDIEGPDPEIEQVAADQRATSDTVFSLKAQQRHGSALRSSLNRSVTGTGRMEVRPDPLGVGRPARGEVPTDACRPVRIVDADVA